MFLGIMNCTIKVDLNLLILFLEFIMENAYWIDLFTSRTRR